MKFQKTAEQEAQSFAVEKGFNMLNLKWFVIIGAAAIAYVGQPKFSDWVAKEIDATKKEIAVCEIEISALKQKINFAASSMDIETYAKTKGWDFVNLKNDQIVLKWDEKRNKYEEQDGKPKLLEQILLSFTE